MATSEFWAPDRFLGLVITLLSLMTISSTFVQTLERWAYAVGVGALDLEPFRRIAAIGIHHPSSEHGSLAVAAESPRQHDQFAGAFGRQSGWPHVVFFEPPLDPGLQHIDRMFGVNQRALVAEQGNLDEMSTEMVEAVNALGANRNLSNSLAFHSMPMTAQRRLRQLSSAMQGGFETAQAFHDSRNAFSTVDAEL
jgi:hypothetical protein